MLDFGVLVTLGTLTVFILSILLMAKLCECAVGRIPNQERNSNDTRIFIIDEFGGDVAIITDEDAEKHNVKYSYENLAPPPYLKILSSALAESSYEMPPPYPIDTS